MKEVTISRNTWTFKLIRKYHGYWDALEIKDTCEFRAKLISAIAGSTFLALMFALIAAITLFIVTQWAVGLGNLIIYGLDSSAWWNFPGLKADGSVLMFCLVTFVAAVGSGVALIGYLYNKGRTKVRSISSDNPLKVAYTTAKDKVCSKITFVD